MNQKPPRTSLEYALLAEATGRSVLELLGVPRHRRLWLAVTIRVCRVKFLAARRFRG